MENAVGGKEDCAQDGRSLARGGEDQLKAIRWEQFLPRRFLRVLLVEHDDSTRHIVAALLRKCSYHVAVVADGLKAWEVMKEKCYSFDLVLTEFEMPSLSGIGLLGKIVGADECKNIPVIMMSSQDSVGIVHKCMLKGAADFLVKPVRKNELRNLWQHVWRRHCSSRYARASENNAASNQISSNAGDCSQTGENSDEGSDAQNLGCKPDVKLEISQKQAEPVLAKHGQSPRDAEAHPEKSGNYMTTIATSSVLDDNGVLRDKTLVVGDVAVQPIQMNLLEENSKHTSHGEDDLDSLRCAGGNEKPKFHHQINSQESAQNIDGFMKSLRQCSHAVMKTAVIEENVSSGIGRSSQMNVSYSSTPPLWDLSLMTQLNGCGQHHVKHKNMLNHSNASAFSRYGGTFTNSAGQKPNSSSICIKNKEYIDQPESHVSSLGPDKCKDDVKCSTFSSRGEGVAQFQMFSDENMEEVGALSSDAPPPNASAGPSNREHTTFHHAQLDFMRMHIPVGAVPYTNFCTGYGALLRPITYQNGSLMVQSFAAAENETSKINSDNSRNHIDHFPSHSGSTEFRCHDLNHPLPFMGQVNDTDAGEQRDLLCSHREDVYQSASASKDMLKGGGSNGSCDTTIDASGATGTALESGNESGIQNCSKKGINSDLSHREAALIKFRLKRKDRCFEKKVRYHSRQKLAEQRPRVKGQFVCQKLLEINTTQEADC